MPRLARSGEQDRSRSTSPESSDAPRQTPSSFSFDQKPTYVSKIGKISKIFKQILYQQARYWQEFDLSKIVR